MQVDSHSLTAVMVAAVRAYHAAGPQPRIFDDPLARLLLSPEDCHVYEETCGKVLQNLNPFLAASCTDGATVVRHASRLGVGAGTVLVRARYIEQALLDAINRGVRQYVLVGAGLDTFAFRRRDVGDRLRIFEVDHPATQAFKQERLASAGLMKPAHLFFAAADFERESLFAALDRTPFDLKEPTFFAWAGVTMYLTREAILGTLRSIGAAAPRGSELVFDYLEPGAFAADAPPRVRLMLQRVKQLGEPMVSGLDPASLDEDLASAGLRMVEDLGPRQVQARLLNEIAGYQAVEYWHLALTAVGPT